ncbi:MAG: isochorismatase family cysteine hydrolase [Pseudomonadota bacterium]
MCAKPFQTSPSPASSWTVHEDHVSLVRAPSPPRIVRMQALPAALELDLARCALVVIDMQNDFCHPDGWFGSRGVDISPMCSPIPAIAGLSDAMRAAGARIVWLNWGIRADRANLPPGVLYRGKRSAGATGYGEPLANGRGPALVQGSWGAAQIGELPAHADDLTVNKHRLSGFWDSELDSVLRQAGITTLLFAGINIDRCVFSTLQDAGFLGYDCVLVEDACATPSPQYVSDAILFLVRELHGFTVTTADIHHSITTSIIKELP